MRDVSLVIPFWDLDRSILQECIDSIWAQTHRCHILVVDNASTVPVAPQDGIEVLRLEKRVSVGQARNLGLAKVDTPFVMFMDADDVLLPGAVSHLLDLIASRPGASLAAGRIIDWVPETGLKHPKQWPSNLAKQINRFPHLFRLVNVFRNVTPVTGCAVMHTQMAQSTGGFPDSRAEDWTFGVSMSFKGPILLSDDHVKLYRWRADGLSKAAVRQWKALIDARTATRVAVANDTSAPSWIRTLLPVLAVLHLLDLPFHVRREQMFSQIGGQITNPEVMSPKAKRSNPIVGPLSRTRLAVRSAPAVGRNNGIATHKGTTAVADAG